MLGYLTFRVVFQNVRGVTFYAYFYASFGQSVTIVPIMIHSVSIRIVISVLAGYVVHFTPSLLLVS